MTLATHAVVGAAAAQLFPSHPIGAFCAAFASHFVLDAIPHWDYRMRSRVHNAKNHLAGDIKVNKDFLRDLIKISFDVCLGIYLSLLLFADTSGNGVLLALIGIIGGVLPDALQFAYFKIRREPLTSLQRFHHFIHSKTRLENLLSGVLGQAVVVATIALIWYAR